MLPKLNHSSSDELSLKRCPLIIIAFFMIMQIEGKLKFIKSISNDFIITFFQLHLQHIPAGV
jgi:hypothetical protein